MILDEEASVDGKHRERLILLACASETEIPLKRDY
jgi:hypothetical protein